MDAWADAHAGLAHVVAVIDPLGSSLSNPLCSNTARGDAATYVEQAAPAWIKANPPVTSDRSKWAIGSLSNGGTCALQVVGRTADSPAHGSFLALSPELNPTPVSYEHTPDTGFDGDEAAHKTNDPLELFSSRTVEGVATVFSVDTDDALLRWSAHSRRGSPTRGHRRPREDADMMASGSGPISCSRVESNPRD